MLHALSHQPRSAISQRHLNRTHRLVGRNEKEPARLFYTNLEAARVAHFRRPDVRAFTEAVRQSGGISRHRWGDAIVRYMQVALFATPEQAHSWEPGMGNLARSS